MLVAMSVLLTMLGMVRQEECLHVRLQVLEEHEEDREIQVVTEQTEEQEQQE